MPRAATTKAPAAEVTTEAPEAPSQTAAPLPTGEVTTQQAPAAVMAAEIAQVQEPAAMPPQEPAPVQPQAAPQPQQLPTQQVMPQPGAQYAPQAGVPGPQVQYLEGPAMNNGSFPQPQVAPPAQVANPNQPQPQSQNANVAQNLGFIPQEITVSAVTPTAVPMGARTRIIRVNEDIENMSITAGGRPPRIYSFQQGHQYQVPLDVAAELDAIGKLWH